MNLRQAYITTEKLINFYYFRDLVVKSPSSHKMRYIIYAHMLQCLINLFLGIGIFMHHLML